MPTHPPTLPRAMCHSINFLRAIHMQASSIGPSLCLAQPYPIGRSPVTRCPPPCRSCAPSTARCATTTRRRFNVCGKKGTTTPLLPAGRVMFTQRCYSDDVVTSSCPVVVVIESVFIGGFESLQPSIFLLIFCVCWPAWR